RAAPEASRFDAGELLHAVEHLLGGLVGEGEQEDFLRAHTLAEQVGDAVGEGAGLARAGAGEHEQRAGLGGHGGELLVVERGAKIDRRNALAGRSAGGVEVKIHACGPPPFAPEPAEAKRKSTGGRAEGRNGGGAEGREGGGTEGRKG